MGEYLSTPKKDKNPIDGQNAQVGATSQWDFAIFTSDNE
jgi:hypothetical protein